MADVKPQQRRAALREQAGNVVKAWQESERRAEASEAALAKVEKILVDALGKVRAITNPDHNFPDATNG